VLRLIRKLTPVRLYERQSSVLFPKHNRFVPYPLQNPLAKWDAGFHPVGFYSNVDVSFLPVSARGPTYRVAIYVEKACRGGCKPTS